MWLDIMVTIFDYIKKSFIFLIIYSPCLSCFFYYFFFYPFFFYSIKFNNQIFKLKLDELNGSQNTFKTIFWKFTDFLF